MSKDSVFALIARALILCFLAAPLPGCAASLAAKMVKKTAQTTGNAMRSTSRVVSKPFRDDDKDKEAAK